MALPGPKWPELRNQAWLLVMRAEFVRMKTCIFHVGQHGQGKEAAARHTFSVAEYVFSGRQQIPLTTWQHVNSQACCKITAGRPFQNDNAGTKCGWTCKGSMPTPRPLVRPPARVLTSASATSPAPCQS
eukprot:365702-Chlamydomonas_euryale.AAC.39